MTAFIDGNLQQEVSGPPPQDAQAVYFVCAEEARAVLQRLGLEAMLINPRAEGEASRYISYPGFDCISLSIPDRDDMEADNHEVDIFLTGDDLVFVHSGYPTVEALIAQMKKQPPDAPLPPEQVLYRFFNLLTEKDSAFLQDVEEDIAALEDDLAADKELDYIDAISQLRKKLLRWKRYYEALFDLLVDLEENRNGLYSKQELHYFHIITNRADRLSRNVLNLRDYVTQVREAYQNQIDISMNQTMKLFTVVSTIFLPLSLIAGWYGMNLQMPEYGWRFAYPAVVLLCLAVVAGCIVYFKKNKWF